MVGRRVCGLRRYIECAYVWYVKSQEHPGKLRVERILRRMLKLDAVWASTLTGVRLRLMPDDFVQFQILRYGVYEPLTLKLLRRLAKGARCVLDIGAHIGSIAIDLSSIISEKGVIVAVEANPTVFVELLANIQENNANNVVPVLGVADATASMVELHVPKNRNWGQARIGSEPKDAITFNVFSQRLDSVLEQLKVETIDLMKVDVEGAELRVLKGLLEGGAYRPRHIILEHEPTVFDEAKECIRYLEKMGYVLRTVDGAPFIEGAVAPESNIWAKLGVKL